MDDPFLDDALSPCPPISASPTPSLSPSQLALARSRAYGLFGQLFLHGLTEETLPYARAVPELASALPLPFDPDEAAAEHHHLFGFNVFPYQSIFLDPAGLLGGDFTEAAATAYQKAGFDPDLGGASADHIGYQLGFLAFLCRAEHDGREDELPAVIARAGALQADFLDAYLLPWLPPFSLAVERQHLPFYAALATLTVNFAAAHRTKLGAASLSKRPPAFRWPSPPDLLADQETGLGDVAAYLLTPVYSGLYLGRDDIAGLARGQQLPTGFGGRQQMLLNLLRSAVTYDRFQLLLKTLQLAASEWADAYGRLAQQPAFSVPAAEWQIRAAGTASLLSDMSDRLMTSDP